ncbi:helix-turn-helix transcriptional regulator [Capsulimonas corticalis]|nr:helix-turn-helix transcriptional regulator [Capsulimonas corticalis]
MEIRDPGSWYFYPKDGCEPWRFLGFNFRGVESHVAVRGLVEKHGAVYTPPANSEAIQRLLMMESTGYRSVDMSAVDGSRMVFELLMLLAESVQIQNALDTAMNYLTRETLRLINTEAGSRFTVEALAHQLGVSREHLSRVFQSKIGRSLRDIIQLHRMRHACYLLKETKLPLKVIADRVGYANSANFSRSFQQFFQMTPSEFRTRGSRKALLSVQVPGE